MKAIFLLFLTASTVVGCAFPPTMQVRVYEVVCKGKWTSDANCAGPLVLGSELEYDMGCMAASTKGHIGACTAVTDLSA